MLRLSLSKVVKGSRSILALGVLIAAMLLAAQPAHASTTFTVTNTNDSDAGSLRQAILDANANSNATADTIKFAIPGTAVKTISPASALPTITGPVTINGYSQPGAEPNDKAVGGDALLKIELNGAGVPNESGLVIEAANSTIKGLVINRFGEGIRIEDAGATGNRITGNYVGTDKNGTADLGNDDSGVIVDDASDTVVGGTSAGERNVISGNGSVGVEISGPGGNKVMGNYIGTAKNGTTPLGNDDQGVFINRSPNNTVGGTSAGERNVISANDDGVLIFDAGGNKVMGNYIGTDASGQNALGNGGNGVDVSDATNTTIGGTTAGARNVISGNNRHGVEIFGEAATGNRILSNSIFSNGLYGIDLYGTAGPTANDLGDADTGPNNLQNKPVLTSARKTATGKTVVRGNLDSTPTKNFLIQFFSNPPNTDEGKTLLDQKTVPTDGSGNVSFTFTTTKAVKVGANITATATKNSTGDTSEFSAPRRVVGN